MSLYPPAIQIRLDSLRHAKNEISSNAEGRSASFQCGSFVAFSMRIDASLKTISDISFRSNGCGYMIAAADVLVSLVKGRQLSRLHGVNDDELKSKIDNQLSSFPSDRRQCANVCIEALRQSFADFRLRQIEEFRGEEPLICTCFGVTEETIQDAIKREDLRTVDEVSSICNAGDGCGSCRMLIQEIIDNTSRAG